MNYRLKRKALALWGNTPAARKWLRSIALLGDNWILAKPAKVRT